MHWRNVATDGLWPQRLHRILERAMAESSMSLTQSDPLPAEFWDLQYFALDIHEALYQWVLQ